MSERDDILSVARDAETEGKWDIAMQLRAEAATHGTPIDPASIDDSPWHRGEWSGEFVSLDGCDVADFEIDDVAVVLGYGDTGADWDGRSAGIVRLRDGRFVVWESDWGPTGSGFSCDAYGGDADIAFATTAGAALGYLSERSREFIRWP